MNSSEISQATKYLEKLIGLNLEVVGRASSVVWFIFEKDGQEYALHLQTAFRLTDSENVLFTGGDMFWPTKAMVDSEGFDWDTFDWDVQGNNRYDEKVCFFNETYKGCLKVKNISVSLHGDLFICLDQNIELKVFTNDSKQECWRFIPTVDTLPQLNAKTTTMIVNTN